MKRRIGSNERRIWEAMTISEARFVVKQWNFQKSLCLGAVRSICSVQFSCDLSFPFVSSVLEPNFHLCFSEMKLQGQGSAFR